MLWSTDGLKVVELGGGISAAYGARLLADFGAEVVKVEAVGVGDQSRRAGPFADDDADPERSGLYLYLNHGKRSITLDIDDPRGGAVLGQLLAGADVLIENLGAGVLDALPLPDGALHEQLTTCQISPYGQEGPKADRLASEIGVYASSGMMFVTGMMGREPLKHGLNQAAHLAGINAASAALAAVMLARRTGGGQRIDISEQEAVAWIAFPAIDLYTHTGAVMARGLGDSPRLVNSRPMETSDGWVMPSYAGIGTWWDAFAQFIGLPELAEPPYDTSEGRQANAQQIDDLVAPVLKTRSAQDVFHDGQEWGLTFGALQSARDVLRSPQLQDRGFLVEQQHAAAGRVRMPGRVPRDGANRREVPPAPLLGEHTDTVLAELGVAPKEIEELRGADVV